jgi:hypothetical protein
MMPVLTWLSTNIVLSIKEVSMREYTGAEYLMIDAATNFGLSKVTFEKRIQFIKDNLNDLESLVPHAKEKALYLKAVYAIRDTQAGKPTGHLVGLDASSSGMQIMSAVMGCKTGAINTGLVNDDEMPWAYKTCIDLMQQDLGYQMDIDMADVKQAVMTYYYGSEAKPKEIFGDGTAAYAAFFRAAQKLAPEAYDLRNILINSWQGFELKHSWKMPDGFNAIIRVMTKQDTVIKVPELDSSFTHIFTTNEGQERGLSLAANPIHSIDAMIVREINRRCNYHKQLTTGQYALSVNQIGYAPNTVMHCDFFTSVNHNIVPQHASNVVRKQQIMKQMLTYKPFEVVCVHDEFKCHPNNMNIVRYWYKEILADLADSTIMQDIIRQIHGVSNLKLTRASDDLGDIIRNSNYGIA